MFLIHSLLRHDYWRRECRTLTRWSKVGPQLILHIFLEHNLDCKKETLLGNPVKNPASFGFKKQRLWMLCYDVVSKVFFRFNVMCFVATYLNKYLSYCVVVYTDRSRILYSIHRSCSFFPNFNFLPLFSLLPYDVVKRFSANFLYEFKLN